LIEISNDSTPYLLTLNEKPDIIKSFLDLLRDVGCNRSMLNTCGDMEIEKEEKDKREKKRKMTTLIS